MCSVWWRGGGVPQEASPSVPPPPNKSTEDVYSQDELGSFLFTRTCHSRCFSFLTLGCSVAVDQLGPKDEDSGMNLPLPSREDWDGS